VQAVESGQAVFGERVWWCSAKENLKIKLGVLWRIKAKLSLALNATQQIEWRPGFLAEG
jgi:hypothetical protein